MAENPPEVTQLDGTLFGENQPCFGCGPSHPFGFRLRFEREADAVVTRFTPQGTHQGPPGIMHGGLVLTLADEIAAWAVIALLGKFGFTVQVEAKLRAPVRVGIEVVGRGVLLREGSRIVRVGVKLAQGDAQVFSAELGFALMDAEGAERLLGGPLPEAWRRFAR
jgi:acyl-coenzyme A thioesterase PaaI-like protein